jgi:hypothetical protein
VFSALRYVLSSSMVGINSSMFFCDLLCVLLDCCGRFDPNSASADEALSPAVLRHQGHRLGTAQHPVSICC